jgi:Protein of unknown function (DUF2490)
LAAVRALATALTETSINTGNGWSRLAHRGMRLKHPTLLILTGLLAAPAASQGGTGEPDKQLWTELDVVAPLASNTTITGIGQVRLSATLSNPILTALGGDVNYRRGEWTLSLGYRHQVTGNREGEDINVTQYALMMGTWARRFGRSTIAVRTRVENTITASGNPWRARFRVEYRWATVGWGLVSYLFGNDEVFYRFSDDEFWRNRLQAGCNLVFSKHMDMKVYYQRQDSEHQTPGAINALGVLAAYTFE